jgi:hypothetical protein
MKRTCISLVALSLLCATACSKDKDKDEAGEAATPGGETPQPLAEIPGPAGNTGAALDDSLLGYVPADSPFVVAVLRPLPGDFVDYMAKGMGPLAELMQMALTMSRQEEEDPLTRALADEIDGKISRAGFESLGFTMTPRMVFYAIGWSVAMRVELRDGKSVSALIDRIEQKSGSSLPQAELRGVRYREFVEDDVALVIAVIDNYLVAGVMHENARAKVLPVLLGLEKPEKNMAQAGTVRAAIAKYKLLGVGTGVLDAQAVARMLTGQATGLSKEIMDASQVDLPQLSEVCKKEFNDMAGAVPRMVFGYQSASAKGYEGLMSVELRPDLAKELAALQTASLDLERLIAGQPLFAMGAAMELDNAIAWLKGTVKRMTSQPYQCEHLQEFNQGLEEMAQGLSQPLPPFVGGAHGIGVVLDKLEMSGFAPSGEGFAVLGVADPMALLDMAKKEAPPLAGIKLEKGKPIDVPIGLPGMDKATLLIKDRWLGASVGSSMTESMTSFMASRSNARSPFMVFAYDYKALMKLSQGMNPESMGGMDAQFAEIIGNLMGYSTMSMHFTTDGVLTRVKTQTP